MTKPLIESQVASDGYPIHVAIWPTAEPPKARVVVVHGVQSHGGWYHNLGLTLAEAGYEAYFPDRRGSGANRLDRGHTPHSSRLIDDLAELLQSLRAKRPSVPIVLAGISWGAKPVVLLAGKRPELVDAFALICPGLHPRVGVSLGERLRIALAFIINKRKTFAIPLSDPALFTASPVGQAFIANDPLGLHAATAGLLAASTFIDLAVKKMPPLLKQPSLLMLAGEDRIADNDLTLAYFESFVGTDRQVINYPKRHHTLEFEDDPGEYARDLIQWMGRILK